MAKEKSAIPGDRIYTIPLRRSWSGVPAGQRANRAVNEIKGFLVKHMNAEDVRLSEKLNKLIWSKGNSKPPAKVKVKVSVKEGLAAARLPDEIIIEKKEDKKKPAAPQNKIEELRQKAEAMRSKKSEDKKESKSETKKDAKGSGQQEEKQSLKDRFTGFVKEMEDDPEGKPKESASMKETKGAKTDNKPKKEETNSKQ